MTARTLVIPLSVIERVQLVALVEQFADLVSDTADASTDPALRRLAPDAYPDDDDATAEFHDLTRTDLLGRRADDAGTVLRMLRADGPLPDVERLDDAGAMTSAPVTLDPHEADAWLRTLAALRLVLASRLGVDTDPDAAGDDPRLFLYEWLGAMLDALVTAVADD